MFETLCQEYLLYCETRHLSASTIDNRRGRLRRFTMWCRALGLEHPQDVSRKVVLAYQRHLFRLHKPNGKNLSAGVQRNHLLALKMFFSWLTKTGVVEANPAADLDLPRLANRLPRDVLSQEEAEQIIAAVDLEDKFGFRDRAVIEVFYATGLRRSEVRNLDLRDIDWTKLRLFVRDGKGKKDRVVPISERAAIWIERYLNETRDTLVARDEQALFLNFRGVRFTADALSSLVRKYVKQSGVAKTGACHLFRHTMATQTFVSFKRCLVTQNSRRRRFIRGSRYANCKRSTR